ncbi:MAG: thioredoxin domain-containing protein, partial [Nitrospinota bacterium]
MGTWKRAERLLAFVLLLVVAGGPVFAAHQVSNRLAHSTSAYLRAARYQPVHWYEWGAEAFQKAQELDRPILLDIGAIWCHWCHVMDRETYESPEIARLINQHFLPIKVDRDARPDIDRRYQKVIVALTGRGGWPLTLFLTPQGEVIFGGTYFPPQARLGKPGMQELLPKIATLYRERKAELLQHVREFHQTLSRYQQQSVVPGALDPRLITPVLEDMEQRFEPIHGGFDPGPKFPRTAAVELALLAYDRDPQNRVLLHMVTKTLQSMARGGIFDQIGGGFHRYVTDAAWLVPHFEKLLNLNAELLRNYLHAYQATGEPLFKEVALSTFRYVQETLSRQGGGFYASQDADMHPQDDGRYYTWTGQELLDALPPEEAPLLLRYFDIPPTGQDRYVLAARTQPRVIAQHLSLPLSEVQHRLVQGKS